MIQSNTFPSASGRTRITILTGYISAGPHMSSSHPGHPRPDPWPWDQHLARWRTDLAPRRVCSALLGLSASTCRAGLERSASHLASSLTPVV